MLLVDDARVNCSVVRAMTYVFRHFVLEADALCLEELLEGLLFLAARPSVLIDHCLHAGTITYRLMLLNWCSPMPAFKLTVISNVRLAETAPPTRDMVMTAMFSI